MDKHFVKVLMDKACDPTLVKNVKHCLWDGTTKTLTMPEDEEEAKKAKLEEAAWYNGAFGDVMDSPKKKGTSKMKQMDPEGVYKLGDDHSINSIHNRFGSSKKGYGGSPGAPYFQVGEKKLKESKPLDGEDMVMQEKDEDKDLNLLSKRELIKRLSLPSTQ